MRLVLWTFGLIFLKVAYSSDKYLQVTNYDEIQEHVDSSIYAQDDEPVTQKKPRFWKLDQFMKQRPAGKIGNAVDQSELSFENLPVRHKKHSGYKTRLKSEKKTDQWEKENANRKSASLNDMMQNDAAPLSAASQSKMQSLGTEEKVREKFQSQYGTLPRSKEKDLRQKAADDHYEEMKKRTLCKFPIPKLVRVQDVYPDPSKTYMPSCTIIHQCSEESGCCHSEKLKCDVAPNSTQNVTLYFRVLTSHPTIPTIESLTFLNHTTCKCQLIETTDRKARGVPYSAQSSSMGITSKSLNLSYMKRCPLPCPSPFSPLFTSDGNCVCECSNKNEEICLKYKRGEMYFNFQDNHCLFTNQCIYPSCAYGNYLTRVGRCPRQYEHRDFH